MKKSNKLIFGATLCTFMSVLPGGAVVVSFNDAPAPEGLAFGSNDLFAFGSFGGGTGSASGNDFGVMTLGMGDGSGHGNSVPIDPATLNGGAGLAVGDVLRYSMWIKEDAASPVTGIPGTPPLLKFEFHNNQLDGAGTQKQFDTEVNAALFTSIDATVDDWTLYSFEYEVNGANFTDVSLVQEIRPVLFAGQFGGTGAGEGTYFMDNVQVEWFDDAAAAAAAPVATTNPNPIPEPSAVVLSLLSGLALLRRRR